MQISYGVSIRIMILVKYSNTEELHSERDNDYANKVTAGNFLENER